MKRLFSVFSLLYLTCVFALGANVKPTIKPEDATKLEQRVNKLLPKNSSHRLFFVYGRLLVLEPAKTAKDKNLEYILRFEQSRYLLSKADRWEISDASGKSNVPASNEDIRYILQVLTIGAGEEKAPVRREVIKGLPDPNSLDLWLTRHYYTKGASYKLKAEPRGIVIPLS